MQRQVLQWLRQNDTNSKFKSAHPLIKEVPTHESQDPPCLMTRQRQEQKFESSLKQVVYCSELEATSRGVVSGLQ
jgi:hypothetical protein